MSINSTLDENGTFNVLAGAGAEVKIRQTLGNAIFDLTNITFNSTDDLNYAPITDDDAMRRPGSNYERTHDLSVA